MKRMQALQPQMAAIKEKYKDDPVKMNKKTMEFMKENKVSRSVAACPWCCKCRCSLDSST